MEVIVVHTSAAMAVRVQTVRMSAIVADIGKLADFWPISHLLRRHYSDAAHTASRNRHDPSAKRGPTKFSVELSSRS